MSFRFFRPWEDGGQGNTRQKQDQHYGASSNSSKTTRPPEVLSVQAEQCGVPSEEATRSVQVLSYIPGPWCQEKDADRRDGKDVWNTSPGVVQSTQNSRVSQVTVLRQTSVSDSSENANNKGNVLDSVHDEAANHSQHNCKLILKSSCQRDKHSSEAHKTHSSIASIHLTPTTALQNDSIEVVLADMPLTFCSTSYSLNSLSHLDSLMGQNYFNTKAVMDMSADVIKDLSDMNRSKVVEYSSIIEQGGQNSSPFLKEECCAETFPDASSAGKHKHHQLELKPFQCEASGKSFSQSVNMRQHKQTLIGSSHFQCTVCKKTFSHLDSLRRHEQIHSGSKPFKCSVCQKAFRQSSSLHVHEHIHAGSKPFKCPVCEKTFTRSSSLQVHERIHTGSKPFKCSVCDKTFKQSGNLHAHERIHRGSKPFKCMVCKKAFTKSGNLHVHERIHTGSKPFKCMVCKKAFTESGNLRVHERIHTGSKPFKCMVCKKAFTESGKLRRHDRIHTGSKPFKCTVCEKAFADKSNMHVHERIHT